MPNVLTDFCIVRKNGNTVVEDYGCHDGERDGRDLCQKYYSQFLQPGETLEFTECTRTRVDNNDLSQKQLLEIRYQRQMEAAADLQARINALP